ncbi:MAG: hypothetical protein KatS3mg011_0523 [Acidimicrobiia bacterium]|nr:MAG: hypothetical protein KatS3mg011_0523 [Acidimicrobiia bacterium]
MPSERPWLAVLALVAGMAGIAGLMQRIRGNQRLAGLLYCIAAFAPNGLYLINIVVFAVGIAAIAGISIDNGGASHPVQNP